jgi:predicted PurR-regulated permease PerM
MPTSFNNRIRQMLLLLLIIFLAIVLTNQLAAFIPGFLGAVTLYILCRSLYFTLTIKKKWNKTATCILFIVASLLLIALPIYFSIQLLSTKIIVLINSGDAMQEKAILIGKKIQQFTGFNILTPANIKSMQTKAASFIPSILNSSASIVTNFAIMFFILYYLLINGREVEKFLNKIIPLKDENISLLGNETKNMIRANAIGIPVLAIIQGIVATIGYAIFGVQDYALWGFITGICSMIPVVGTIIIWGPLVAYFFAVENNASGIGLLIFALIIITNIDYVARLTLLKRITDIHPLVTIFGVIIGISLFGFWGVIFGPLLISYFIILFKIYINEFGNNAINTFT